MAGIGGFTPASPIWWVSRESALMLGGGRALLLQGLHPLAVAGFIDHSDYDTDPWGRLRRTMDAVWASVYGDPRRAEAIARRVQSVHRRVHGVLERPIGAFPAGTPYDARDPETLLWIHATIVDTALLMYRTYVRPMSRAEQEGYYEDSKLLATRMWGIPERHVPPTLADFRAYVRCMLDGDVLAVTPEARMLGRIVIDPPVPLPLRAAWQAVNLVTAGTLPPHVRQGYGFAWSPAHAVLLRASTRYVRRAVMPVLPDLLRALPDARRAERALRLPSAA
jgi:uncharacterized protein (DUF2236 family)